VSRTENPQRSSSPSAERPEDSSNTALEDLYPPSPRHLPPLALLGGAYRLRVVWVLVSLFLFLAFYLALVAGSAYVLYQSWLWPTPRGRAALVKLGAIAAAAMLFLFLLKGLFKRKAMPTLDFIELEESSQPALFRFLRRLCRETGTAFPAKVYANHDINAAVFYPRSLLTLVLPTRRNLLIGLGLVNVLNLTEFKAVLAHEFGHFAQSSMKLGQYVYVANGVIADMVFQRDFWDSVLEKWKRVDLRLSFPAWGLSFLVWILRWFLGIAFRAINLLNFSLSRQMEFNADLHAVRLTGSDALISGLAKTELGSLAFQMAVRDLLSQAQHRKYTDDLFHHQSQSLDRLSAELAKGSDSGERGGQLLRPYQPGPEIHFQPAGGPSAGMWATHPSHRDREVSAKMTYIPHDADERPSWVLFRQTEVLRRGASVLAYREFADVKLRQADLTPARVVEEQIREERQEMEQAPHYHGLYDNRPVLPGDLHALAAEIEAETAAGKVDCQALRAGALEWTGQRLESFMTRARGIDAELNVLGAIASGQVKLKESEFEFRGRKVHVSAARGLLEQVQAEHNKVYEELRGADRALFRYFYFLSGQLGAPHGRQELMRRYEFLHQVQDLIRRLNTTEESAIPVLEALHRGAKFSEADVNHVKKVFRDGWTELKRVVEVCESILLPRLSQLAEESSLRSFVLPQDVVPCFHDDSLSGEWLQRYLKQFQQVLGRLRKLHFKNLGLLLRLQERMDPKLFTVREDPEAT
jgi:Zn-dependent protease with chaperone function